MAANGNLIFQDTNKATFVGANSNVVIDTVNASFGVGVDVNGPTSNLHVVGNCFVTSNLEVGTANLFVDTVNSRVGVGTTNPEYPLDINKSTGDTEIRIEPGSNAQGNESGIRFDATFEATADNGPRRAADLRVGYNGGAWGTEYMSFRVGTGGQNDVQALTTERMRIAGNGNVGIGTTNPSSKLEVFGTNSAHNTTIYPLTVTTMSSSSTAVEEGIGTGIEFRVERQDTDNIQNECGAIRVYGAAGIPSTADYWNMAFRVRSNDTIFEPMTLMYNGNVGIGTVDPKSVLHVSGDTPKLAIADNTEDDCDVNGFSTGIAFVDNTWNGSMLYSQNPAAGMGFYLGHLSSSNKEVNMKNLTGELSFGTRNVHQAMYIDNVGNVGIGTTNPGAKLDIKGTIKISGSTSGGYQLSTNSTGSDLNFTHGAYSWGKWSNAHHYDVFSNSSFGGARDLYLNYYSGAAVRLTGGTAVSSDDRIKTNERYITNATGTLLKLKPQIYDKGPSLGGGTGKTHVESGLIVQDIYYDAPELRHLVHYDDDAEIPDEKPYVDDDPQKDPDYSMWGTKSAGLNYEGLIAYLIKSNQELHARIQALENA